MSKVLGSFTIALLCAIPAAAIPVYINDATGTTNGAYAGTQRWETRFRVSDTNWDLGIGPAGTNETANVGNSAAILPVLWQFELASTPGTGIRMRVKNSTLPAGPWTTVLWSNAENLGGFTPFARAFNTLRIQVTSTGTAATARNALLSKLSLFMGPGEGYRDDQGLTDLTVTRTTPASTFSNFPSDPIGNDSHWVYANGNIGAQAWRLTGLIDFNSSSGNPGNALKLSIFANQYTYTQFPLSPATPIPEPGGFTMVSTAAALALAGRWATRRR